MTRRSARPIRRGRDDRQAVGPALLEAELDRVGGVLDLIPLGRECDRHPRLLETIPEPRTAGPDLRHASTRAGITATSTWSVGDRCRRRACRAEPRDDRGVLGSARRIAPRQAHRPVPLSAEGACRRSRRARRPRPRAPPPGATARRPRRTRPWAAEPRRPPPEPRRPPPRRRVATGT